jgi:hypothetical protein
MFGCPTDQINSFFETFTLIPESEDDENCTASGRILTAEEFVERFKNRDDIFSINENIKLNSSEIITLLCAIIACSTYDKANIEETSLSSGLPDFSFIEMSNSDNKLHKVVKRRDMPTRDALSQSRLNTCKNDCYQNVDTAAASIAAIAHNGLNIPCDTWTGFNIKASTLLSISSPRGPPLQISTLNETEKTNQYMSSLKCKNAVNFEEFYGDIIKNKVVVGSATLIRSNESNYAIDLLHECKNISSLLLQADRRHPV